MLTNSREILIKQMISVLELTQNSIDLFKDLRIDDWEFSELMLEIADSIRCLDLIPEITAMVISWNILSPTSSDLPERDRLESHFSF